jgi:hypothetical protein
MRKIILAALLFLVACGCERSSESGNSGNSQIRNPLDTRYPILKDLKKRFDGLSQSELVRVEFFLRFGDETSLYSADKCIRNLGDRFPSEMIPIACTNDSCIVISCRQKDDGAIHYVDRTNESDNDPERNLRIIGNSFEVFLRDLRMSE